MDVPPIHYARTEDGVNIAYWTLGEGPPVVALDTAGLSHLALEWEVPGARGYYEGLARTFQVIRLGFRCSAPSGDGDLTFEGIAADLAAVVDAIGAEQVTLVPGGAGLVYGVPFATRFPQRVNCIVAVQPNLASSKSTAVSDLMQSMSDAVPQQSPELVARLLDPDEVDPPGPLERLVEAAKLGGAEHLDARTQISSRVRAEIGELRPPLLVVDRPGAAQSEGTQIASLVPGAQLVVRAGRAHHWYDPDPDGLIALIRDFVLEHVDQPATSSAAIASNEPADAIPLSPREREVVALVAAGKTNLEIADALVISSGTVARHVSNMLAKTGLKNRVELAAYAIEHGLRGEGE